MARLRSRARPGAMLVIDPRQDDGFLCLLRLKLQTLISIDKSRRML